MRRFVTALALIVSTAGAAQAQDGMATLKKVQAAYLGLKSYSQRVTTMMSQKESGVPQVTGQSSELRYQAPNRMLIQISSPKDGSVITYNNSSEMLIYRGKANAFAKRPGKANVKEYVKALREYGVGTMLDPLAFLTGEPIQTAFVSVSSKPDETVDGVKCDVVLGKIVPAIAGKAGSGTATYWIDKTTNLARKIQISFTGIPMMKAVPVVKNGKQTVQQKPVKVDTTVTMSVQAVQVNPAFTDSSFAFHPPKNAVDKSTPSPSPN